MPLSLYPGTGSGSGLPGPINFSAKSGTGKAPVTQNKVPPVNNYVFNKIAPKGPHIPTALEQLQSFVDAMGVTTPATGGGGGGTGAARAAATARYGTNRQQLTDIYGQLRDQLAPIAGQDAASYNAAIANSNTAGGNIAATAQAGAAQNDAQRNAAFASLGVPVTTAKSLEDQSVGKGLTDLASNNGSFANLMAVLSQAQQGRDNGNLAGAASAGTLAQQSLTNNYESYLQSIASSGGGGGRGGKAASYSNPFLKAVQQAQFGKLLDNAGLGKTTTTTASPYTPAGQKAYQTALTNFVAANPGKSPSAAQIQNELLKGKNSSQGINFYLGLQKKTPIV